MTRSQAENGQGLESPAPRVSVVVPTRNRPDHAEPCVESILRAPGDGFDLTVIDQSDSDATERALSRFTSDPRFRYHRSSARGAANARNAGIERTRGPLLIFTDDDCRVAIDWVEQLERAFSANPEVGMIFGRVTLPADVVAGGFAAEFEPHERLYHHRLPGPDVSWGIGANMAVRRSVFDRVGLLDPLLGPGARFPAAEETDFTIRAIAQGVQVLNVKEASVVHLGIRSGADASKLARGYALALGAAFTKHLRLRTSPGSLLLLEWVQHYATQGVLNVVRGKRPTGLGFVAGMLLGACRSLPVRVDSRRSVFAQG